MVALDQISKLWVRSNSMLGESFFEAGPLSLTHIQNTGSAFGLFANQTFLLTIVAIAGLVIILLFYRQIPQSNILGTLALSLVFSGALGNLIDRLRFGYVTDFIYVRLWHNFYWPAFNVADSAITIGTIALVFFIFTGLKKEHDHPS